MLSNAEDTDWQLSCRNWICLFDILDASEIIYKTAWLALNSCKRNKHTVS